ncbi:isocitrate lyase [Blumeria hordei DH14]|uniref:Isocitrate lyase n=1 Tax=Blumeria graminis f. sp. hordei (strain DH14) TaxID=546991 RepID=N1JP17_BLUG1|nr:isocitrate lyase [Blumeria hordei DH14]
MSDNKSVQPAVDFNSEIQSFLKEVSDVKNWWIDSRWRYTKRVFTAEQIVSKRGNLKIEYPSNIQSKKLWCILENKFQNQDASITYGCLEPTMLTQMAKYLDTVYVSGWQCSSTASASDEPGPDLADYPYTTVPNKVGHLFMAQLFHDRKQREERITTKVEVDRSKLPNVDYLRPIIADADTGHGGLTAVMKLTKLFIEKGAAGIHIEDQAPVAIRAQGDIMGTDLLVIARTDAEAATLITTTIDPRDHAYILGSTNPKLQPLQDLMTAAENAGKNGVELQDIEDSWIAQAQLKCFSEAVIDEINASVHIDKKKLIKRFLNDSKGKSCLEARALARGIMGVEIFCDWDSPRTREGYYRLQGGCECAISRAIAYAPYADAIWMESKLPDFAQAEQFAKGVHAKFPEQKLAYNLSPSFNWSKAMSRLEQDTYIRRLAKLGYCWQFITLAGLHTTALVSNQFSKAFSTRGMRAYGELVQEPEIELEVDVVKHQKWSGANYVDEMLRMIQGGISSTSAMGKGVTEDQFH